MVIASFHTHTKAAKLAPNTPQQLLNLIDYSLANNVGIVALTDHEWVSGEHEAERAKFSRYECSDQRIDQLFDVAKEYYSAIDLGDMRVVKVTNGIKDTYFLRGQEFHAAEPTKNRTRPVHILGFGYEDGVVNDYRLDPATLIGQIHEHDGIAIVPHPYNILVGGVKPKSLDAMMESGNLPDALEGFNAQNVLVGRICDRAAQIAAARMGVPWVAGPDAHRPSHIKCGYVEFPSKAYELLDGADSAEVVDIVRRVIKTGHYANKMQGIDFEEFVDWWQVPCGSLVGKLAEHARVILGKK